MEQREVIEVYAKEYEDSTANTQRVTYGGRAGDICLAHNWTPRSLGEELQGHVRNKDTARLQNGPVGMETERHTGSPFGDYIIRKMTNAEREEFLAGLNGERDPRGIQTS